MKILITGANGQLGKDLQKQINEKGYEYIATDYLAASSQNLTHSKGKLNKEQQESSCEKNTNYKQQSTSNKLRHLDITDFKAVDETISKEKPKVIINCAAYNDVDKAEEDWETAYSVNGLGVRNLAVTAERIGAFLVHYSTDYVFDGEKGSSYTIYDEPNPISKYGESKYLGEKFLEIFSSNFALIRTSKVFGIGNENIAKKLLGWAEKKQTMKLITDEISVPTYTVDLAEATLKIIENFTCGIYHITNNGECSKYEYGNYLLKKIGWRGKIEKTTQKDLNLSAKRPKYSKLDNYGLKETINFEMPDWESAVDRFLGEMGTHI